MKQFLQKTLGLRAWMMVAMMVAAVTGAWAEDKVTLVSGSGTSDYAVPTGWTSVGTVAGGSYLKFDDGTITSPEFAPHTGLSFTYSVATFGSGTNHPLTIRILNASTDEVIVETTTATPSSSTYINTGSPLSLGDINVAFKIQLYAPSGKGVRLRNYSITGNSASGSLEDNDFALIDAPIDLSFDLYNNSSAQVINYTTSSTGAVTIADNDYATFDIDEDNKTITVTPTAVTSSAQTITVSQAADDTYKAGSATFTVTISDSTPVPTHTVTFSVNGETTTSEVEEGAAITFPTDISDQEGKSFVGWVTEAIDGVINDAPEFVTSATMGESDITYYAVFAYKSVTTDSKSLTIYPTTTNFPTKYDKAQDYTLEGKVFNILQVYKPNTKDYMQWRAAGNKDGTGTMYNKDAISNIQSIVITYTDGDDHKNFSLNVGASANPNTGIAIDPTINGLAYTFDCSNGVYDYFVLTNGEYAGYLSSIVINYLESSVSISDYCTTVAAETRQDAELSFAVTEVNANISDEFEAPTLNTAEGFNGTVEYTSSDESVAQIMDSETGDLMLLKEGTTTITATFAGNEDFKAGSASYTLNVADNRIATTISQENIVLDASEVATLTQLNPVVKDAEGNVIDYEFSEFLSIVSFEQISEDDVIGSIDCNTGAIILSGNVGTATLKAYYNRFNDNTTYKPSECTFTITVESTQTIAEARAQGTGSVTTKGVVTSCSGTTAYIQDANAAICVYGSELTVGDEIKVSGTLKTYNGLLEITNPTVTVLSQNNTVTPEVMTIAEINVSENQGWLVKIEDATVTAINGQNTTIAQGDNTIVVRGITDVAIAVDDVITLTGNIGCFNAAQIANPTDVTFKVSTPTFDPESGEVMAGSAVAISTTTEDATIYYTTNGDEPTTESTVYTDPITINEDQTIKAIAVKDGMTNSDVATATYTIIVTPTVTLNPNSIEATAAGAAGSVSLTYANLIISDVSEFDVQYYDVEGEETVAPDWIDVEGTEDNSDYVVSYLIAENTDTEARTAYFKVYAMDDETNLVYSNLVTVSQAGYVIDYATLPFEWNDDDTTSPQGVTNSGVGTYTSTPKLKFDGTGDYLILKINERPGTLTFDIKGNSFSGGTFNVQTSEDGVTYTDLETYTELGNTQNEEFNNLGENVRYIKWIYTEKVSGNVALGNIALAKYVEPQPAQEYELSWSVGENVNEIFVFDNSETEALEGSSALVLEGNTVYVSVGFNDGYELEQLTVSAGETPVDITEIESGYYSFVMPAAATTITVSAKAETAAVAGSWIKTELADLTSEDVFVIVGNNDDNYAMSNDKGTGSAPAAVGVTITNDMITSEVGDNIKWNISGNATDGYTFYPNGETESWLYCTNTNNGVRVGTNENNVFTFDGDYLFNNATERYVGIYNSQDWRCYTSNSGTSNIANQTFSFYKQVDYARSIANVGNYGTICLPYNATISGAQLYSIAGKKLNEIGQPESIVIQEEPELEAGKPYIFQATKSMIVCKYTSEVPVTTAESVNGLVGSLTGTTVDENMYLVSKNQIILCGTGCTIGANRAYIDMSHVDEYTGSEAGVKMLTIGDTAVGIAGIGAESEYGSVIYNIAGQRVQKAVRGLYIVDGKKVLVK